MTIRTHFFTILPAHAATMSQNVQSTPLCYMLRVRVSAWALRFLVSLSLPEFLPYFAHTFCQPNSVSNPKQELQRRSESDIWWILLFAGHFHQTSWAKEPRFQWVLGCVAKHLLFTGKATFSSRWRGLFMLAKQWVES